jgi:hypothetical protein
VFEAACGWSEHIVTKTFWLRALGLAGLIAVLGAWAWIEAIPAPAVAPQAGQAIAIDKSPGAQADRQRVIDKLLAGGLVRRIDPERGGKVGVSLRPQFMALDEATRRSYADVIYRYHFDGSNVNDAVVLRDARHGNEVGRYNPYQGGLTTHK